jgi:hypothetical protein
VYIKDRANVYAASVEHKQDLERDWPIFSVSKYAILTGINFKKHRWLHLRPLLIVHIISYVIPSVSRYFDGLLVHYLFFTIQFASAYTNPFSPPISAPLLLNLSDITTKQDPDFFNTHLTSLNICIKLLMYSKAVDSLPIMRWSEAEACKGELECILSMFL